VPPKRCAANRSPSSAPADPSPAIGDLARIDRRMRDAAWIADDAAAIGAGPPTRQLGRRTVPRGL
jgi:hypothetical protein